MGGKRNLDVEQKKAEKKLKRIKKEIDKDKEKIKDMCVEDLKKANKKYEDIEKEIIKMLLDSNGRLTLLKLKDAVRSGATIPLEYKKWVSNIKSLQIMNETDDSPNYYDVDIAWQFRITDEHGNVMSYQYQLLDKSEEEHGEITLIFTNISGKKMEWDFYYHGELHDEISLKTMKMLRINNTNFKDFIRFLEFMIGFIAKENKREYKVDFFY